MLRNGQGSFEIEIKEVVHLSHEQLPIEEIQEMELVPQIESREFGDQIEIVGSLYLFGDYKGNQEAGRLDPAGELPDSYEESVQFEPLSADRGPFSPLAREDRFEYRIPVRISLPRGKVRNVEDVYAYINSFDYELRSPYQIEVVASLMINGLVDQEEETEARHRSDEQFEFVHMADPKEDHDPEPFSERLMALEQQVLHQEMQLNEEEQDEPENRHNSESINTQEEPVQQQELTATVSIDEPENPQQEVRESQNEPQAELEDQEKASEEEREDEAEELDNVIVLPRSNELEEERPAIATETMEEEAEEPKEEVKVAISNKGSREDQEPISSLSSFLANRMKKEEQAANQRAEQHSDAEKREEKTNEALYLTNFMESSSERFTKLKICILQKNETLEEVAERYQLSVDHILRANQAVRNQVAAGQLLYIPVKG